MGATEAFLRREIRNRTKFLILAEELRRDEEALRLHGTDALADPYGAITNPQRVQNTIDRYERWLVRKKGELPVKDPVFQKIAWLCGMAHDVLPEIIQDAHKTPVEVKAATVEYVETIYRLIHGYIMSSLRPHATPQPASNRLEE